MNTLIFKMLCVFPTILFSQNENISGVILSRETNVPLNNVIVKIKNTGHSTKTDLEGKFILNNKLPLGEQIINFNLVGYISKNMPIVIEANKSIKLGNIELTSSFKNVEEQFATIDLAEINTQEDDEQFLLQANRDPFFKSVAFNWSSTFFKVRGLANNYSKIIINGFEMNKLYNNKPNWSNWSGLNDVLKSQEISNYTFANEKSFGDLNGVTQFNMNPSAFSKSNKISVSSTNRSYQGRIMATFHSGMSPNNWAYSFSASARSAKQGYLEGTNLNAFSVFSGIEHKLNNKHNISFNFIYTPVERGKSSPNTTEVTDLKGTSYNAYWGYQNGEIRNSRIKTVKEPILTLSHFWKPNKKITFQNNILYQKGTIKNSRLDYTGTDLVTIDDQTFFEGIGTNTDPTYYQKLPSYSLRNEGSENYEAAFLATKEFEKNGQIDWASLYEANNIENQNNTYILYNDVTEDRLFAINSIGEYLFTDKITLNGKLSLKDLKSKNYAQINDLLGGPGYLDIDAFSEGDSAQNDLQNPNRIAKTNDKFKYNYNLLSTTVNGFIQAGYIYKKWKTTFAFQAEVINYQREGIYENGNYPGELSLGKSDKIRKYGFGTKLNATYQVNPKIAINSNLFYKQNTPTLQNILINPRQSNQLIPQLQNETNTSIDINLNYQYNGIITRASVYYLTQTNSTKNSFFFSQDIAGLGRVENADFFQEIITDIDSRNFGFEFGSEIELTTTLSCQLSAAFGNYTYTNNPQLQITSDRDPNPIFEGQTNLKNYRLANGPQQAYGLGFNYRDPSYWWLATQFNFFDHSYINISPFLRTSNFATDIDGLPFNDYNEVIAKELLQQEKFTPYFLWNIIGGKSWRIKGNYLGITIGVQNILNQVYKTGGFEQSRNSNYQSLNEDKNREYPLFGSKYWHGTGTTFYVNTYIRF